MRGKTSSVRRAVAAGVAGAALAAFGMAVPGTASASEPEASALGCLAGYLCIQPLLSTASVLVPAGTAKTFDPALPITAIVNDTGEGYCVLGDPSFAMPTGSTIVRTQTVSAVAPSIGECPA